MVWARALVAGGVLLLCAGFAVGVDPGAASVGRHSYGCASVIPSSWLVAGTPDEHALPPRTAPERRVAAACAAVVRRNRILTWGGLGVGGLVVLVGWTVLHEHPARAPRAASMVRA